MLETNFKSEQCKQKHMQSIRCDSGNFSAFFLTNTKHSKLHRSHQRKTSLPFSSKADYECLLENDPIFFVARDGDEIRFIEINES